MRARGEALRDATLTSEVSYDDGATGQKPTVQRHGKGEFSARVTASKGATYAAPRTTVRDGADRSGLGLGARDRTRG
ncbi:hypothetical protein ABZY09_09515 [Streptomyces sp. NPDC002928]|uniref:hypothetical protein n=1 Tax=Streptomyces sp. NPDC002928 TaxID=3154440 RepID=UPI0033BE560E